MNYLCPVCGYEKMLEPPQDYYICPCCGTEFGNDDTLFSYEELRLNWIERGMTWFSDYTPPPNIWSPIGQLALAGKLGEKETEKLRSMGLLNRFAENRITDTTIKVE